MTYAELILSLEARGVMPERRPALEPVARVLHQMNLPMNPARVVVVAGTNGKGSVCASLEALALSAGQRTGLYTSPHLVSTTERIRIGGQAITEERFVDGYAALRAKAQLDGLSHFEVLTLLAAELFFGGADPVDLAILEVGMGGIWDATNAVPHRFCGITSIGFDHQNFLGDSLLEIAANKFGIVGEGCTVVHAPLPAELEPLKEKTARRTGARFLPAAETSLRRTRGTLSTDPLYTLCTHWGEAPLALPGARGAENSALALTLFEQMGFDPAAHLHALSQVRWPGRMSRIRWKDSPDLRIYISGDHNPQGIQSLIEILEDFQYRHLHLLVGVGADKDLPGILEPLFGLENASVYLTEIPFRGRKLADYGAYLARARSANADAPRLLGEISRRAAPEDLVVITGSLYLCGKLLLT